MRLLKIFVQGIVILLVTLGLVVFVAEPLSQFLFPVGYVRTFRQNLAGLRDTVTYERTILEIRSKTIQSVIKPQGTVRLLCLGASTTGSLCMALRTT